MVLAEVLYRLEVCPSTGAARLYMVWRFASPLIFLWLLLFCYFWPYFLFSRGKYVHLVVSFSGVTIRSGMFG